MIYFLVNNTFHLTHARKLADEIRDYQLGLIQVPYSLRPVEKDERFRTILTFARMPYTFEFLKDWPSRLIPNLKRGVERIRPVKKNLRPSRTDTLFVYTETELLNQVIIKEFKDKGAKIFLLEDGAATSTYFGMESDPLSKRATLFKWVVRAIYGIKGYYPFNVEGYYYPIMSDRCFSGLCLNLPYQILRNIPVFALRKEVTQAARRRNPRSAIFLNQPIYSFYTDFDRYLNSIDTILANISRRFDKIIFKYHPDDLGSGKVAEISRAVGKYPNITTLETESVVEDLIEQLDVSYAISYFTSALWSLIWYGVQPIYVYHLLHIFNDNRILNSRTRHLASCGYNFPSSFDDVKPGYDSGLMSSSQRGIPFREFVMLRS